MGIESRQAPAHGAARVVRISFLIVCLMSGAIGLLWTVTFMTNDDTNMAAFASGDYTGHPSAHLVFVSAPLGLLLAALHSVVQGVPWYALMLISIDICSASVLVAIAYARRNQLGERGQLAVIVLALVGLPIVLLRPSFTVAAIVLCTTGIIMLAAAVRSASHARLLIQFGSICVGIGAMVRFDSFMGVVAVFLPFIAIVGRSLGWRRSLTALAIVTALLAVSSLSDRVLNSSSDWSSYIKFNEVRGQLSESTDFQRAMAHPTDPSVAKVLRDIKWSDDDVVLFNSWLFYDQTVYSTAHLSELTSLVSGTSYNAPISDSALLVLRSQRPLWVLVVSLGIAAAGNRQWRNWVLMLVQLSWCAAVFSFIAASQRFPDRISIPLYLALGIVLILGVPIASNSPGARSRGPLNRKSAALGALLVGSVLVGFHLAADGYAPWDVSRANQAAIAAYRDQREVLKRVDPVGRFLCLGSVLTIEGTDALATTSGYRSNSVLCTGWPTGGPSFAQRRSALGSTPLMLDTLVSDNHFFLVLYPFQVPVVERLYLRYMAQDVSLDEVGRLANGGIVCRVRAST